MTRCHGFDGLGSGLRTAYASLTITASTIRNTGLSDQVTWVISFPGSRLLSCFLCIHMLVSLLTPMDMAATYVVVPFNMRSNLLHYVVLFHFSLVFSNHVCQPKVHTYLIQALSSMQDLHAVWSLPYQSSKVWNWSHSAKQSIFQFRFDAFLYSTS